MDKHRGELIHGLRVVLPEIFELLFHLAHRLTLAFELRSDVRLLVLQASDEIRRDFGYRKLVLLREEVSCCSKSRGERSVLRRRELQRIETRTRRNWDCGLTFPCVSRWMRSRDAFSFSCMSLDFARFSGSALSRKRSIQMASPNLTYAWDLYACCVSRSNCTRCPIIKKRVRINWKPLPEAGPVVAEGGRPALPPCASSFHLTQLYHRSIDSARHIDRSFRQTRSNEDEKTGLLFREWMKIAASWHPPPSEVLAVVASCRRTNWSKL